MSESTSGYLSPDEITNKSFDTKRRGGLDPDAVARHLASVAATVHALSSERAALAARVEGLQAQLAQAAAEPVPQAELDEDALTERLGQDAARVLAEARAAAADRIAEAEEQADDIRAAAEEMYAERSVAADLESNRIRESAEAIHAERAAEAEQSAAEIIARAEADAEALLANVVSDRQSSDAEGARIIREAELTRRQILEDLARRRSAARRQIEQLRAGRERLLASHETVRRALDEISEELTISMSEARAAAETAGHSVSDTTIEELEAEIETARLTGLLDTGPMPVVAPRPAPRPVPAKPVPRQEPETVAEADAEPEDAVEQAPEPTELQSVESEIEKTPTTIAPVTEVVDGNADSSGAEASSSDSAEQSQADAPSGAGLADVVQLDRARNDLDTAAHPATGRDSSANRASTKPPQASTPPKLESVETLPEDPAEEPVVADADGADDSSTAVTASDDLADLDGPDDLVDDLFASLRSTPDPKPVTKKTAAKKKKSTAKKSTAKKSAAKKAAAKKVPDEIVVDSSDVARRLKRVLADEQSRAMSRLRGSEVMPSLDDLLGERAAHGEGYWVEVVAQVEQATAEDVDSRVPVDELVESIRHRVGQALDDAHGDSESAVESLRSVYREIKTQRIVVCADQVCRIAAGRSADHVGER